SDGSCCTFPRRFRGAQRGASSPTPSARILDLAPAPLPGSSGQSLAAGYRITFGFRIVPVLLASAGSPGLPWSAPSASRVAVISRTLVNAINPQFFTHNAG